MNRLEDLRMNQLQIIRPIVTSNIVKTVLNEVDIKHNKRNYINWVWHLWRMGQFHISSDTESGVALYRIKMFSPFQFNHNFRAFAGPTKMRLSTFQVIQRLKIHTQLRVHLHSVSQVYSLERKKLSSLRNQQNWQSCNKGVLGCLWITILGFRACCALGTDLNYSTVKSTKNR